MTVPRSLYREVAETIGCLERPVCREDCLDLLTLAGMLMSAAVPSWGLTEEEDGRVLEAMEIVRDLVDEMDERGEWKHEW